MKIYPYTIIYLIAFGLGIAAVWSESWKLGATAAILIVVGLANEKGTQ